MFRVSGLGLSEFRVWGLGVSGSRITGHGFRVLGLRVFVNYEPETSGTIGISSYVLNLKNPILKTPNP